MPIKKDGSGKRWVEMDVIVPGTPEQVWQAVATGAGYTAWFTRTSIEERVGGAIRFQFGPEVFSSGEVTAWQPPHRFGYVETEWMEGAPPVATEVTVTARAGGQCTMRMVHSLFSSTDDWDDQLEGFESGWPGFFQVLRLYLGHHAGQPGGSFQAMAHRTGSALDLWRDMMGALGLAGADLGERRTLAGAPEALSGTVELVRQEGAQRVVLLRIDGAAPGVLLLGTYQTGDAVNASLCRFVFGPDGVARAEAAEGPWRDWLQGQVGSEAGAAGCA